MNARFGTGGLHHHRCRDGADRDLRRCRRARPWPGEERTGTFRSQTLFLGGGSARLEHLTVENTAGDGADRGQALAVYADASRVCMVDVSLHGNQDTLFTAPLPLAVRQKNGFRGPRRTRPGWTPDNTTVTARFPATLISFSAGPTRCLTIAALCPLPTAALPAILPPPARRRASRATCLPTAPCRATAPQAVSIWAARGGSMPACTGWTAI